MDGWMVGWGYGVVDGILEVVSSEPLECSLPCMLLMRVGVDRVA